MLSLYQQLKLLNDDPRYSIIGRLRKLSLMCHPDQGGTQEAFVRLKRAHQTFGEPDACNDYELEGCEAANDLLNFKNNVDYRILFSLGRQQINFLAGPCFVLVFLFRCDQFDFSVRREPYSIPKRRYFGKIFETSIKTIDLQSAIELYLCDMSLIWAAELESFHKATVRFRQSVCFYYTAIRRVCTDEVNKTVILPSSGEFRLTVFTDEGFIS